MPSLHPLRCEQIAEHGWDIFQANGTARPSILATILSQLDSESNKLVGEELEDVKGLAATVIAAGEDTVCTF